MRVNNRTEQLQACNNFENCLTDFLKTSYWGVSSSIIVGENWTKTNAFLMTYQVRLGLKLFPALSRREK
jgi:hypothetical protein